MSIEREAKLIAQTESLVTQESLVADLLALGIKPGWTVLMHSSLSKLGWVCGGAVAVILAIEEVLGEAGTIIMPTHSGDNSDPEKWEHPPVPEAWFEIIRAQMPAYDPYLTPTRGMGRIPELFRTQKGVLRSNHPTFSFAARGVNAVQITNNHRLESDLGEGSPLQKIYDLDGWILLLGVGYSNNTSLHLAEYRSDFPGKKIEKIGCSMKVDEKQQWVWYSSMYLNEEDFEELGKAYELAFPDAVIKGKVGMADVRLMRQRPLVDFAVKWMQENR